MASIPAVDPLRRPSRLERLLVSFVLSRPGTWFYMHLASRIDPWLMRLSRGQLDCSLGVAPVVLMTARGARTGAHRTVPLLYFNDGEDVILMASSFGRARYPGWYHNLKANPDVSLYRRGQTVRYRAREVEGEERSRLFDRAVRLYRGYRIYEGRVEGKRTIPVLRLSAFDSAAAESHA